jgi:capsule polysaccharide modification protein KpsS
LRGTGELFKKSKNFYYIDHGYLGASNRVFHEGSTVIKDLDGYFRVVHNDFIGFKLERFDHKRLDKLNLNFKKKRTSGEYIILSEPSQHMINFFNLNNWVDQTITNIKKHTDRKIFLHNKFSTIPLDLLLKKAWAFVSFQSTAGFKAMLRGVPAHFTYKNLENINSVEEIESGEINPNVFSALSYNQWTLKEFDSGEAWEYISKIK